MARASSPVLDVMLRPLRTRVYRTPHAAPSLLTALRGPAFLALVLGAALSLSTTGRLTLRLLASTTLLWSFVPLLQVAALFVLLRAFGGRGLRLPAALELYFFGVGPWSLWLIASGALYAFVPVETVARWSAVSGIGVLSFAPIPILWSALITYGFLHGALQLDVRRALFAWVLHYVLVCAPVAAFFLFTGHLVPRLLGYLPR